jgi:hypothetical protein
MTARGVINQRFGAVMRVAYVGGGLFLVALVAHKGFGFSAWVWVPGVCGFAVAWLTIAGTWMIGIRCPNCDGRLTSLLMHSGGLRLDPAIRFCPYCKLDFDSETSKREKESGSS